MSDELKVPDEMKELMFEWKVSIQCRDKAIASTFKAKRAIYYGKMAEKANSKFWKMAKKLYPQIADGIWRYSFETEALSKEDNI